MEIAMASWRSVAVVILSLCCIQLFFVNSSEHDSLVTELLKSASFDNVDANYDYFYDGDDLSVHVQYRDGFQEDGLKSHRDYFNEKDVQLADDFSSYPTYKVVSEYSTQKTDLKDNQKYLVFCSEDSMKIVLPSGLLSEVKIFGIWGMDSVLEAPKSCGYSLTKEQDHNVFSVGYSGCRITVEGGSYTLRILYRDDAGRVEIATASCDTNSGNAASLKPRFLQSDQPSKPRPPMPLLEMSSHNGCLIPNSQRVECTASGADQCRSKGCCLDVENDACYYPMNECTADGEFVFAISTNVMNVTVNPLSLVVAERSDCKPVVATKDFVIFKFGVTECGTHCYSIGETTVYLAELHSAVRKLNLKYGVITRDQPIRLMVECRYTKGAVARASAGYMVVSASRPASVMSEGLFGVQLRIAEDKTFSRFYAYHHQPLRVLLGKSVYLEVRLNSPNPKATLLVHYCVAYPRSARNALVLLYEGCPNPLDSETTSILHMADLQQNRHRRRFEIKAFQFMDQSTNKLLNEEIYFMCSTEVCLPSKTPCKETCFDEPIGQSG